MAAHSWPYSGPFHSSGNQRYGCLPVSLLFRQQRDNDAVDLLGTFVSLIEPFPNAVPSSFSRRHLFLREAASTPIRRRFPKPVSKPRCGSCAESLAESRSPCP